MTEQPQDTTQSLLTFPCYFPIKVMGEQDADLETFVNKTLEKHVSDKASIEIRTRESKHKNYLSVTATFNVQSQQELDTIYKALAENKAIKFIL